MSFQGKLKIWCFTDCSHDESKVCDCDCQPHGAISHEFESRFFESVLLWRFAKKTEHAAVHIYLYDSVNAEVRTNPGSWCLWWLTWTALVERGTLTSKNGAPNVRFKPFQQIIFCCKKVSNCGTPWGNARIGRVFRSRNCTQQYWNVLVNPLKSYYVATFRDRQTNTWTDNGLSFTFVYW